MNSAPQRAGQVLDTAPAPLSAYGLSHRGAVRAENEDSWFTRGNTGLALVADGVGGHGGGAAASALAASAVDRYTARVFAYWQRYRRAGLHPSEQEDAARRALYYAHRKVTRQLGGNSGSTLVGLWAPLGQGRPATIFHVGDSRAYLFRNGELLRLTKDHSLYQQWVDAGRKGDAPNRKYVLQALGISERIDPALHSFVPLKDDQVLLCSDGLSGSFTRNEMAAYLREGASPELVCDRLIAEALARGVRDNVTAVICAPGARVDPTPLSY